MDLIESDRIYTKKNLKIPRKLCYYPADKRAESCREPGDQMISIVVVDVTAQSRSRLVDKIVSLHTEALAKNPACPQIDIKPLSIQELKFAHSPALCVIGPECLERDLSEIASIRKLLPRVPLLADLTSNLQSFIIVEQMARLGVDDVLSPSITSDEFMRKLIFLLRESDKSSTGTLIVVDSGKGGLGATTIAASIAEAAAIGGKRTALVDLDVNTQDLARFLLVQPYVNENLNELLRAERPVVRETVEQCASPVWGEKDNFWLVSAPSDHLGFSDATSKEIRNFLSFLEILNTNFEVVVIDLADMRSALRGALLRVADKIAFVVGNDAASIYPSVYSINKLLTLGVNRDDLKIIDNSNMNRSLPAAFLREEILRATKLASSNWMNVVVPYCRAGARWPASGGTLATQSGRATKKAIECIAREFGVVSSLEVSELAKRFELLPSITGMFSKVVKLLPAIKSRSELKHPVQKLNAPKESPSLPFTLSDVKQLPAPIAEAGEVDEIVSEISVVNFNK